MTWAEVIGSLLAIVLVWSMSGLLAYIAVRVTTKNGRHPLSKQPIGLYIKGGVITAIEVFIALPFLRLTNDVLENSDNDVSSSDEK